MIKKIYLLLLPAIVCLLSSCISSDSPFHTESSKVTDDRLLGRFEGKGMTATIQQHPSERGHYQVRIGNETEWLELDAVLIKIDGALYIEVRLERESVGKPTAGVYTGPQWIRRVLGHGTYSIFGITLKEDQFALYGSDTQSMKDFITDLRADKRTIEADDVFVRLKTDTSESRSTLSESRAKFGLFDVPIIFVRQ